jgi:hypothetical protein
MCMALWRADRDDRQADYVLSWDGVGDD